MFTKIPYKTVLTILLLICLTLLTGNTINLHAEEGLLKAKPKLFTKGSANSTASIKLREKFHVVLDVKPSTGYVWQVIGLNNALLKKGVVQYRPKTDLLGGPEEQIIPFTALKKGQAQLELQYMRPWKEKTPSKKLQSFTLNINITE